jgi:hypothetical protein
MVDFWNPILFDPSGLHSATFAILEAVMGNDSRVRIPLLEAGAVLAQGAFSDHSRSLNAQERRLLLSIFGDSVNLDLVQLVLTSLTVNGRAYTLGNTIRRDTSAPFDAGDLVHEMTHIWQYQTQGTRYISDSVLHQLTKGKDAYDVDLVPGQSIYAYAAEQQATIVELYYRNPSNPKNLKYKDWAQKPDVVRMIGEISKARPLADTDIQQETWFGPNRDFYDSAPSAGGPKLPRTVPLIRIEF